MRPRGENIEYDKLRDRYEALAAERGAWAVQAVDDLARIRALEAALTVGIEALRHAPLTKKCADALAKMRGAMTHLETFAEPAIDQAPIARVIVTDDAPAGVVLYAPGLPPGEFDVYLEPTKGEQG